MRLFSLGVKSGYSSEQENKSWEYLAEEQLHFYRLNYYQAVKLIKNSSSY